MANTPIIRSEFIDKAEAIVLENLSDENFGVSELAEKMHMSRSNLLRKIKKETQLSASQFIRQVRLVKSMEMLKQKTQTVSEISYQVGFGSTSYFIKCFREHYGYPPGEVGKELPAEENTGEEAPVADKPVEQPAGPTKHIRPVFALILLGIIGFAIFFFGKENRPAGEIEKSIAVLPFKNQSSDSLNLYFVNGLMESTLNKLQKIGDLRVISRTSTAKYGSTKKSIPEIAEELNVNYLVEGSGQRLGDRVLLNIQLIEASTDRPIWVEQYSREVGDVFALQNEVAGKIAAAIEAVVTPDELKQIEKIPTENLFAYEYYLQALPFFNDRTEEGLKKAIPFFEKALAHDSKFALVYSKLAIVYYHLDLYQTEKQYTDIINNNADKALLYDPKSAESLIAKALYYMHNKEFRLALPHLEKALEYNPNSSPVVQLLSNLYAHSIPNTAKFLKYALKGVQLDIAANDSIGKSYIYLNLSNALIQTGFTEDALKYINLSLNFYPENNYGPYLKIFIRYAQDRDMDRTTKSLTGEWKKDTARLDIMQEVAKFHYYREDYDSAFYYYDKFVKVKKNRGLYIYPQENIKIGKVYEEMGLNEQAEGFYKAYTEYCETDDSIYKSASMAVKYAQEGKNEQAIEQLKIFATQDNYQYWMLLFLEKDPIMKPLKNRPEYRKVVQIIKDRFWENQKKLRKSLEEKGLI